MRSILYSLFLVREAPVEHVRRPIARGRGTRRESRMKKRRAHSFFLAVMCTPHLVGCGAGRAFDAVHAAKVCARTATAFDLGLYYKPGEHGMTGLERAVVPLIVDQADSRKPGPETLICTPNAAGECLSRSATVYSATSGVTIGGHAFDQVLYVWFYHSPDGGVVVRGVRVVVGPDGFPMLWEALSPDGPARVFFVSRALEELAARQHGSQTSPRRFAVERDVARAPGVVVARVLDDGPVAIGPWVYLGRPPAREIVTVLCRCMPSQVSEFVRTMKYDLQPIEAIPHGVFSSWIEGLTAREDLTELLRWPALEGLAAGE